MTNLKDEWNNEFSCDSWQISKINETTNSVVIHDKSRKIEWNNKFSDDSWPTEKNILSKKIFYYMQKYFTALLNALALLSYIFKFI